MAEAAQSNSQDSSKDAKPKRSLLGYAVFAALVVLVFSYLKFAANRDNLVNQDFYRVLYEVSNEFNNNIEKLKRLHQNNESISAVRSLLPNYKVLNEKAASTNTKDAHYVFSNALLKAYKQSDQGKPFAVIGVNDLLPNPANGFSQYLIVDALGNVVTTKGNENSLSVVNLEDIKKAIYKKNKSFELNLSKTPNKSAPKLSLPGLSSHVDIDISHGKYRVFLYPFIPNIEVFDTNSTQQSKSQANNHLFLVGLLSKSRLNKPNLNHWNVSFLFVVIICILFCWTLLRLYLLPVHQAMTKVNRLTTHTISYAFFIVVVALVLAFAQKQSLDKMKAKNASAYLNTISGALSEDVITAFSSMKEFGVFYQGLLKEYEAQRQTHISSQNNSTNCNGFVCPKNKLDWPWYELTGEQSLATQEEDWGCNDYRHLLDKDKDKAFNIKPNYMEDAFWSEMLSKGSSFKVLSPCHSSPVSDSDKFFVNQLLSDIYSASAKDLKIITIVKELDATIAPDEFSFETHLPENSTTNLNTNLLSVFLMDSKGVVKTPSFGFRETNAVPMTANLSHRDYFKQVRDNRGITLTEKSAKTPFENVFIQRLHNIYNGSVGTTISMPLASAVNSINNKDIINEHILAADVLFRKLSLRSPPEQDFSYMVVERTSGTVLFHNNEDRVLVENLYFSNSDNEKISNWIKSGLEPQIKYDNDVTVNGVSGYYHGQSGKFFAKPSIVENWAVVVFYPNDSLNALMTNQFIFTVMSFSVVLLLLSLFSYFSPWAFSSKKPNLSGALKTMIMWTFPRQVQGKYHKKLLMRLSVYIAIMYLFMFILVQTFLGGHENSLLARWLVFIVALLVVVFLFFIIQRKYQKQHDSPKNRINIKDFKLWLLPISLIVLCVWFYFNRAFIPLLTLESYYHKHACSHLNIEKKEQADMALVLFPNSITKYGHSPNELLKIDGETETETETETNITDNCASSVFPEQLPHLSNLEGVKFYWQWVNEYVFTYRDETAIKGLGFTNSVEVDGWLLFRYSLLTLTILIAWYYLSRKVLIERMYLKHNFAKHIERLCEAARCKAESPYSGLIIGVEHKSKGECIALGGIPRFYCVAQTSQKLSTFYMKYQALEQACGGLYPADQSELVANVKINISTDGKKVCLSDVESALDTSDGRKVLLSMIVKLKTLVKLGELNSLRLNVGVHALKKIESKSAFVDKDVTSQEYINWSECLKDFSVNLAKSLSKEIDETAVSNEVAPFPQYKYIETKVKGKTSRDKFTSHYFVLMHLEAFYRYKWELCTHAEKLALFNIANGHQLNPKNSKVIQNLATYGLIRVQDDELFIVNESFKLFVLNAESEEELNKLVTIGEQGVWKQYRIPFTLVIIIGIGLIALTSGESFGIIISSLAGLAVAITTLTNSANLLKSQFR